MLERTPRAICLKHQIKQLRTSLWSVSVTIWRSFAKSLVCARALEVVTLMLNTAETMNPKEISGNHISYMKSLGFKEDSLSDKFPSFYWTPKLHKSPYKHRFIASSFDFTTKVLLSRALSTIKGKLSNMPSVIYSRTGISEMWILKNSSELLQKMNSFHYPKIT